MNIAAPSGDPYKNPELFRWLGSLEGVPDWTDPGESPQEKAGWWPWQRRANRIFELAGTTLPGVALATILAATAFASSDALGNSLGYEKSPFSPILIAIVLGLVIRNAIGLPAVYEAGIQLALKKILRIGVALLGLRLSLTAAGTIGLVAAPIALGCIVAALLLVTKINALFGLPRRLGTLIAVGTAICGNTAIVAMAPVIDANDDEISYAVGCVTVFGLLALIVYPFGAHILFGGDASLAGLFLGTAIHDTAQVAGAGMAYAQQYGASEALDTATVTKLVRNLFLLAVIPAMALVYHRNGESASAKTGKRARDHVRQALPVFVFGFIALTAVRSLGDVGEQPFGILNPETWQSLLDAASTLARWCLIVAMASVGLGTSFSRLRTLGMRPLGVGMLAALLVGAVSFALVSALGPLLG